MVDVYYNNVSLTQLFAADGMTLWIEDITGRGLLSPDVTGVDYKGGDGGRFVSRRLPVREITVSFAMFSCELLDMQAKLTHYLNIEQPSTIRFSDQTGYYTGIVSSVSLSDDKPTYCRGEFVFSCYDPYRYGEAQQVDLAETISIDTNCTILPVLTFTATGKPSITVNGETLSIDKTLTGGVIDSQHNQVMDNGNNLLVSEVSGIFPRLRDVNHIETENISSGRFRYLMRWL